MYNISKLTNEKLELQNGLLNDQMNSFQNIKNVLLYKMLESIYNRFKNYVRISLSACSLFKR